MIALTVACLLAAAAAEKAASAYGGAPVYQSPAGQHGEAAAPARHGFRPHGPPARHTEHYHYEPTPYAFDYSVNNFESGAQFAANENSDGQQTTGYYTVALPDGRVQTVKYTVDDLGGFNAEVTYEGEARYPDPAEYAGQAAGFQSASAYKSSRPSYTSSRPSYKSTPPAYKSTPSYKSAPIYRPSPSYRSDAPTYAAGASHKPSAGRSPDSEFKYSE